MVWSLWCQCFVCGDCTLKVGQEVLTGTALLNYAGEAVNVYTASLAVAAKT